MAMVGLLRHDALMRILVTGASGHLGTVLVRKILNDGHEPIALMRTPFSLFERWGIQTVLADVCDFESVMDALVGIDAVFHLAGIIPLRTTDSILVHRINVAGVKNIVSACKAHRIKRLVHCSTIHAFQSFHKEPAIDETRALVSETAKKEPVYDRSKAAGQRIVMKGIEEGLNAVIVHPTAVIGPDDYKNSPMGDVMRMLIHGKMPALVNAGFNWVDVRDVAQGMMSALELGISGENYILSGHYCLLPGLAMLVEHAGGKKSPRFVSPMWLARCGAPFVHGWSRLTRATPLFTSESLLALRRHQRINGEKAKRVLHYEPRPLRETVKDTVQWYLDNTQRMTC